MTQIQYIINRKLNILELGEVLGNISEACRTLGISRQHLAAIEAPNMNRGLSLELLFNIATVLEIEPYLLLKFSPEK